MTSFLTRRSLSVLCVAVLSAACQSKPPEMTPEETRRMADLTERMTTRCVGRYLIDLPERFVLNSESTTEVEGVKVVVRPMGRREFEDRLKTRLRVLESTRFRGALSGFPFIRSRNALPDPFLGIVIDRARSVDEGRLGRTLEAIGWESGFEIKAHIESMDNTFPEDANDSIAKQLPNDTPQKLAHLLQVYERIRGRKDTEVPTEQGSCIANGFVRSSTWQQEDLSAVYHLKDAPDLWFGINLYPFKGDDALLDRAAKVESKMKDTGHSTLRIGARTITQLPYEEWLTTGPANDSVEGQRFWLHGNETGKDERQPYVKFTFKNGYRIPRPDMNMNEKDALGLFEKLPKATLSPAESIALWDKVTATLRPRPGAF